MFCCSPASSIGHTWISASVTAPGSLTYLCRARRLTDLSNFKPEALWLISPRKP